MSDQRGVGMVVSLMSQIVTSPAAEATTLRPAKSRLVLALISSRQFEKAIGELAVSREEILKSTDVVDVFNFAMAEWGHTNCAPQDLMERVLHLAQRDDYRTVNRHQCF